MDIPPVLQHEENHRESSRVPVEKNFESNHEQLKNSISTMQEHLQVTSFLTTHAILWYNLLIQN